MAFYILTQKQQRIHQFGDIASVCERRVIGGAVREVNGLVVLTHMPHCIYQLRGRRWVVQGNAFYDPVHCGRCADSQVVEGIEESNRCSERRGAIGDAGR
ncbi:hypothetical protein AB0H42_14475 [Nocardia sp. NPDC050799]|uniref:hypothetical protein n=1 Tax=Nocardia sp. NPDC050799 TaxID=3154842 RepID=UPI0033E7F415